MWRFVGSKETVDGFRDEFQYNFSDLEAGVRVSVLFDSRRWAMVTIG